MNARHHLLAVLLFAAAPAAARPAPSLPPLIADKKWDEVRKALEKGADVDVHDNYGCDALCLAIENDAPLDLYTLLLAKGASVSSRDNYGRTALLRALAYRRKPALISLLLEKGADASARDNSGDTVYFAAVRSGKLESLDAVLAAGAKPELETSRGEPVIFAAASGISHDMFMRFYKEGQDVNETFNEEPLLNRVVHSTDTLRFLLSKGADKTAADSSGYTAAHWGSSTLERARLLHDEKRPDPLDNYGSNVLAKAANGGNLEVLRFLVSKGANVLNQGRYSNSPITAAAGTNCLECVKYLRAEGAPLDTPGFTSPLIAAAGGGRVETMKFLLAEGAAVDGVDSYGESAAHKAAYYGHLDALKLLRDKGADLARKSNNGQTPAMSAVSGRKLPALEYILSKVDARKDRYGSDSILVYAVRTCRRDILEAVADEGADVAGEKDALLREAVKYGCAENAAWLLDKKADPKAVDSDGAVPVLLAAKSGSVPTFKLFASRPGFDPTVVDGKGRGLVHYAAMSPRGAATLKLALSYGAGAQAVDSAGWTPLHLAVDASEDSVRLLLDRGADLNAAVFTGSYAGRTPVHVAARRYSGGHILDMLLDKGGVRLTRDDDKRTALMSAAYGGHFGAVKRLLALGEDPNALDSGEKPVLFMAANARVARLLVEKGADPLYRVGGTGYYRGRTLLHESATSNRFSVVKYALEKGVPLDLLDYSSHTPLSLAAASGYVKIMKALLAKGADPLAPRVKGGLACVALGTSSEEAGALALDAVKPALEGEAGGELLTCAKGASMTLVRRLLDGGARHAPDAAAQFVSHFAANRPFADFKQLVDRGYSLHPAGGYNPFLDAGSAGNIELMRFLLERGHQVDAVNSEGKSALYYAARQGKLEAVKFLVEKGASAVGGPRRTPPLIGAADARQTDIIRFLVSKGADVNAADLKGATPLIKACEGYSDPIQAVETLLELGATPDARDAEGATALMFAASRNYTGAIKSLLKKRADPNARSSKGYTVFTHGYGDRSAETITLLLEAGARLADSPGLLSSAAQRSDLAAARLLLDKGFPVDARFGDYYRTALIETASSYGDYAAGLNLLIDKGASLNATDKDGATALMRAADNDRLVHIKTLVERGAALDSKDNNGRNVLHYAAAGWRASTATVNYLLDRNAPVNEQDKEGRTPVMLAAWSSGKHAVVSTMLKRYASSWYTDKSGDGLTHFAVSSGSTDTLKALVDAGVKFDQRDSNGRTALHRAVTGSNLALVRFLLDHGADVDARDNDQRSPLHAAAGNYYDSTTTVKILLDAGADVNAAFKDGGTALSEAIYNDKRPLVEMLLARGAEIKTATIWGTPVAIHMVHLNKPKPLDYILSKGANIHATDSSGGTALHSAASQGHVECVRVLLARGADAGALNGAGQTALDVAQSSNQGAIVVLLRERTPAKGFAAASAAPAAAPQAPAQPGVSAGDLQNLVKAAVAGAMEANKPAPGAPKKTFSSDVDRPGYKSAERPNDLALVIGIERYSGELPAADHAERDAEAVKAHFLALGVPPRNLIHLSGSKAGRASIEKYVENWLPRMAKPDSRVYVYFSGHGAPDVKNGNSYLVPWDGDPNFLETTAYSVSRLYAKLDKLPAQEVLVAMDACFSGAKGRSVLPKGARPLVSKIAQVIPGGSKVVALSASDSNEITGTYDEQGHGLFTYYLLKGLNGAAGGSVTVNGLYQYLKPKVQDEAGRSNREQTPQLVPAAPGARGEIRLR